MDNLLIGWYWGSTPLGYYDRAYRLLLFPLQKINAPITTIAVPALSRLKTQPDRYRNFFRKGAQLTVFAQMPVIVFAFVMAEEVIWTLLGPQWGEAISIFQALLPAGLISTTAPASTWVYLSWGHSDRLIKAVAVNTAITLFGFAVALPYGPFGVAVSFSITSCLLRIPNILYCFHGTPLKLRDMESALWKPLMGSILAGIAVAIINTQVDGGLVPPVRLLLAALLFSIAYLGSYLLLPGGWTFLRESFELITELRLRKQKA
jgi:PST family polysaccharide transporter